MKVLDVTLKNGEICSGHKFDNHHLEELRKIFQDWYNLSQRLKSLGGRSLNVPDVLSEGLFAYFFNSIRTNNTANSSSYDCVTIETGEGVQVKASSILYDCTSFGPNSTWDIFCFMDFAPNGEINGTIHFYIIDTKNLESIVLNRRRGETFRDQQLAGKRPRLSIKRQLIEKNNLAPDLIVNLLDSE